MMKKSFIAAAFTILIICFCSPSYAAVYYVNDDAAGSNNGQDWTNAFNDLQDAMDLVISGDEIWVASGTYFPSVEYQSGVTRSKSFQMKNGVEIYGGFTGSETALDQRDIQTNLTILSGDIGIPGDSSDNCYHVFYHPDGTNLDNSAVFDGFTITGGNANDYGGGIYNFYSSPSIINCLFIENSANEKGGGIYSMGSSPVITNCVFINNSTDITLGGTLRGGGGIYIGGNGVTPIVTNCTFIKNMASGGGGMLIAGDISLVVNKCIFVGNSVSNEGGGVLNFRTSASFKNCIFSGNLSDSYGGGLYNERASSLIINCTFSRNKAGAYGGGIYFIYTSQPTLTNCIMWGDEAGSLGHEIRISTGANPILSYSNIAGCGVNEDSWDPYCGSNGGGNIDSDPFFIKIPDPGNDTVWGTSDDEYGDLHLKHGSPCIDMGDPSTVGGTDMEGEVRVFDGDGDGTTIVDMGADEYVDMDHDGLSDYEEDTITGTDKNDPDSDDDSIPDGWEVDNNLDPLDITDAEDDPDSDGLTNLDEFIVGTDPNDPDSDDDGLDDYTELNVSATDPNDPDCDDDGLLDGEEVNNYLTDPYDPDSDDDGFGDWIEVYRGSDPNDPNSICPLYVHSDATGNNSGISWLNAFNSFQSALDQAVSTDKIWVVAGTYYPSVELESGVTRSKAFQMKYGVEIYGGFTGNETTLDQRDPQTNKTILSGDIGIRGEDADNSYHVFYHPDGLNLDSTAVLDGFVIQGGYADDINIHNAGGGMFNENSYPTLRNCTFYNNGAYFGGGILNVGSSVAITNCIFLENFANSGGGIYFYNGSPNLTNCMFLGNLSLWGGGLLNDNANGLLKLSHFRS